MDADPGAESMALSFSFFDGSRLVFACNSSSILLLTDADPGVELIAPGSVMEGDMCTTRPQGMRNASRIHSLEKG